MRIASIADVKAHFSTFLKESERGPVIITRNGKPTAALVNVVDDDEVEQLILAYSPKFKAILQEARREIAETGGIPHDEFWRQVDAEYEAGENGRVPGLHTGQAQMSDDFDQPLPDEFWNGAP